jgi:methyl-accepting chemotaxis protein
MPDPIQQVITALNFLVTPSPALNTGTPQPVSTWVGSGALAAGEGTVYTPIQTLLGVLFSASSDMTTVGKSVNTALGDIAGVVGKLATALGQVTAAAGDVTGAMNGLQSALALAQSLAPGSSSVVLTSASSLFQQLQQLLTVAGSVEQAAAELAELSQLLTGLAGLFPS